MTRRLLLRVCATLLLLTIAGGGARANGPTSEAIRTEELKEWLTYIASDELQGRALFSTGIGLAAGYISNHLRAWGVQPGGDAGSYLQTVKVLGVKATSRSSVTVRVGDTSRTFTDGQGVTFPRNAGANQRFTLDRVEFVGYGVDVPRVGQVDYAGRPVAGAAVVWLGPDGPNAVDATAYRPLLRGRHRYALDQMKASASFGPAQPAPSTPRESSAGGTVPDFMTTQNLDVSRAPGIGGSEAFFEFLLSRAPVAYAELQRLAAAREPLPSFSLADVSVTVNIETDYQVVRTQLAQNIVGIIEGSDPRLEDTYVAFGAHYDHVGYAEGEIAGGRREGAPGRVTEGALEDRIWNGADDDGSGTVSLMAIAKAFATGTRPKRSILLVWHSGEERGLLGSRYFVDHPTVPLDRIVAQLNVDMVGRNRDNKATEAETVYLVGSDRISTELHEISRSANDALSRPLTLDFALNDPSDGEQLYFRSDHYSYASKGIPIVFFTTGLHPDYHTNTDEVSKIEFAKMTRVAQLVFEAGRRIADLDHPPARDLLGARAGVAVPAKRD